MSRFAAERRVFFVEEPEWEADAFRLDIRQSADKVWVVKPVLSPGLDAATVQQQNKQLINQLVSDYGIEDYLLWYYTPAAVDFTDHLCPPVIVYDCMDELSLFRGASPKLRQQEEALFARASVVFTGGPSLYESKQKQHRNVHCFPSSIDTAHFKQARHLSDPADQASLPFPRLGFFGVIDERFDAELIKKVADAHPDWQIVLIGPVVKIDPASLPQRDNIHYLGMRSYQELPAYLSGWDVALLPFAINEATRFISPTKTPEYLAGGKPVVSTPIRDVTCLYGKAELVKIASTAEAFIAAIEESLNQGVSPSQLEQVDTLLAQNSWDRTWLQMRRLLELPVVAKR